MGNVTPKVLPRINVVVTEKRKRLDARVSCVIGENIQFNEDKLLSYCFAEWKPVVFDMLVVAAAVEFCDRLQNRPAIGWSRDIYLEIPVHDKSLWRQMEYQFRKPESSRSVSYSSEFGVAERCKGNRAVQRWNGFTGSRSPVFPTI
jgi:hypothetical protein